MAFPRYKDIELPLLYELNEAGKRGATPASIYPKVAEHFPMLTSDDLKIIRVSTNGSLWNNMVQWARSNLMKNGEMEPTSVSGRGIWAITDKGRARLARERHMLPQRAAQRPEPTDVRRQRQPTVREDGGDYEERVMRLREVRSRAQRQLVGIGGILQRFALSDYRQDRFQYDVIWKQAQHLPRATHCFQIDSAENLPNALPQLKHAADIWGARLFLVTTDESEAQAARERLMPHFSGEYHAIGADANVLTAADVNALHDAINPMHQLLGAMLRN